MKYLLPILLVFCLLGCKRVSIQNSNFNQVDVSIYNGWTDYYCIKLLNTGKTYVFNDNHGKGKIYFTMTLGENELDSISKMIGIILNTKIDTLYSSHCVDCGAFNLIIKTKDKTFKSHVNGIDTYTQEFERMKSFVVYLYNIADKSKAMLDTAFVFESRTKAFYPPPPPPPIDCLESIQ